MRNTMLRVWGAAVLAGLLGVIPAAPALAADAGLSGTVTNQLTGAPVPGAGIVIQHQDGSGWNFVNSDADGGFAFPDASGDYVVQVMANGYLEQWLHGHQNRWEADVVGAPATLQVKIMPIQHGSVAGRVVSQQGAGIADVFVELWRNGNSVRNTGTDATGRFSFADVETGPDYTMLFRLPSGHVLWYGGVESEYDATEFTVNPDATTTVDLTRPPVGNLTIRAVDALTRAPVAGYCFYPQDGPLSWYRTCTDAKGRAVLRDLPVGEYSGGGYHPDEVYVNGHFAAATVTEGATTTATVRLEKAVSLHVDFVDAVSGDPVDGACLILADPVGTDIGDSSHCGSEVELKPLFAEEHFRLFVAPYDGAHGAQWVSTTGGGTGDPALAKVFQPAPGDRIEVTVRLDGAGTVSGTVTDAATRAGVPSVCPSPTGPADSYGGNPTGECTSDDGRYAIRALGPYRWKLAFPVFDSQHAWAWSGGGVNRASATPVQVVAGQTTDLDVSLPATGTVSGTVTVPAGGCAQCVTVVARDAATGDYAAVGTSARADGTFVLRGFNTQEVRLFYSVGEDMVEYPTRLRTTAGGAVTGVAITIPAS
ncbi:MSCRAMM family protein [Plantactinospora sp. CA-290183]|uniref:MSCRAMM family protein n=1 Tax=Plantactinospora sp. CA-290183 TaxID=3240006 RepID=UPI003D9105F9